MARALVLFSGGLDSRLVVKILQEQGIEVVPVYFKLPYSCANPDSTMEDLKIVDCTQGKNFNEYLRILRNPSHGVGSGMNPCRDCKIFMLKKAKKLLKELNCDFIATGEVLGERPLSQTKIALELIEKKSGLKNKILRPLSAKLFPETPAEKKSLVNRKLLLNIQGRPRNIQIALAKKYNITFPQPAGGCLLCEKTFTPKLKDLFNHKKKISFTEISSLDGFRHFRNKGKILLGRNHQENVMLQELVGLLGWEIVMCRENPGPTCIYESKKDKELAEKLVKVYSLNDLKLREEFEEYKI